MRTPPPTSISHAQSVATSNVAMTLKGYRRGTRRTSSSEAQAEAERTALGAPLGDKASADGGCGSPPAVRSTSKGQEQPSS